MEKKGFIEAVGRLCVPLVLYEILTTAVTLLLTELFPSWQSEAEAMWVLTAVNMLQLPIFWNLYQRDRKRNPLPRRSFSLGAAFAVMAEAILISRGVNILLALSPLPYWFPGYAEVSDTIFGCSLLSQIAASVCSAALLEELLMRGLVYNRAKELLGNARLAMVVSGLIFGIFHGNVVQGIYAFVLGLFLAGLYERYQSLLPPILAHMAANAASVLLQLLW